MHQDNDTYDNRREFFRIGLDPLLEGDLIIIDCSDREPAIDTHTVDIVDVSAGGVRIRTGLDLPFVLDSSYVISFLLIDKPLRLTCEMVRKEYGADDTYEYAFRSFLDEKDINDLVSLLHKVALRQRKGKAQLNMG